MGLSLAVSQPRGGSAAPAFDPATLALTWWWENYGGASPWEGTASAGTSGSNDLSEATNPAAAGAALNGVGTADFDGTNDRFTATGTGGTYVNPATWGAVFVFNADALVADAANVYENALLFGANSASVYWGIVLSASGFRAYQYDGAFKSDVTAAAAGGWRIGWAKYDGSALYTAVDDGAWSAGTATTAGNFGGLGTAFSVGMGLAPSVGAAFNGRIAGTMGRDSAWTDQERTDLRSYIASRWGL
jgi:hypothetical protein